MQQHNSRSTAHGSKGTTMADNTPTVAEIDDEITTARAAVDTLEQRIIDGDTKVTASTLATAREKLDFLGLRRRAAQKAETARSESEHARAVEQWNAECRELRRRDLSTLRDLYTNLVVDIGAFLELAGKYEERADALRGRASTLRQHAPVLPDIRRSMLDTAVHEGKAGTVPAFLVNVEARRYGHSLHTDARRRELESTGQSSAASGHRRRVAERVAALEAGRNEGVQA